MRIAVVMPMSPGRACGGFRKHLREVLPRWNRSGRVRRIAIVSGAGFFTDLGELDAPIENVVPERSGRRLLWRSSSGACGFDVAFCPMARPVAIGSLPLVTMVQNAEPIQPCDYPASLPWRLRLWLLRHQCLRACERAQRVIAVSAYVRERLLCCSRIVADRVDVVYRGQSSNEASTPRRPSIALDPDAPFLFSAGSLTPYRGIEEIIHALAILRREGRHPLPVVHAGGDVPMASGYGRRMRRLAARLHVADLLIWAGQLAAAEMVWCYRHAAAFVQTSRAEACPNILLEAMGNGGLVISCTHPPMPEIAGDTALYYETGQASELAGRIWEVLSLSAAAAAARRARTRQWVEQFNWDRSAAQTLDVMERAIVNIGQARA